MQWVYSFNLPERIQILIPYTLNYLRLSLEFKFKCKVIEMKIEIIVDLTETYQSNFNLSQIVFVYPKTKNSSQYKSQSFHNRYSVNFQYTICP